MKRRFIIRYTILLIVLCIAVACLEKPPDYGVIVIYQSSKWVECNDLQAYQQYIDTEHHIHQNFLSADRFPESWTFRQFSTDRYEKGLWYRYEFLIESSQANTIPAKVSVSIQHKTVAGKWFIYTAVSDVVGGSHTYPTDPMIGRLQRNDFTDNLRTFSGSDRGMNQYYYERDGIRYWYDKDGRLTNFVFDDGDKSISFGFSSMQPENWPAFSDSLLYGLTSLSEEEYRPAKEELLEMLNVSRPAVRDSLNIEADILEKIPHKAGDTVFRIFRGEYMAGFAEKKTILQLTKQPYTQRELYAVANASGITLWELGRDGTLQQTDAYSGREQTYYEAIRDRKKLVKTRGYHIKPTLAFCLDSTLPQDGAMVYFSTDILKDYIYYKDLETGTAYELFGASYMSEAKSVMDYRAEHGDTDPQGAFHNLVDIRKSYGYGSPGMQSQLGYGIVLAFAVTLYCALVEWYLRRRKSTKAADAISLPEEPTDRKRVYLIPGVIEDTPGIY